MKNPFDFCTTTTGTPSYTYSNSTTTNVTFANEMKTINPLTGYSWCHKNERIAYQEEEDYYITCKAIQKISRNYNYQIQKAIPRFSHYDASITYNNTRNLVEIKYLNCKVRQYDYSCLKVDKYNYLQQTKLNEGVNGNIVFVQLCNYGKFQKAHIYKLGDIDINTIKTKTIPTKKTEYSNCSEIIDTPIYMFPKKLGYEVDVTEDYINFFNFVRNANTKQT